MSEDPMLGVQRSLGEIVGELRAIRLDFKQHFEDDRVQFGTINKEIGTLQKRVWFGTGAASAIGALLGIFIKGHQ